MKERLLVGWIYAMGSIGGKTGNKPKKSLQKPRDLFVFFVKFGY